jgi:hypothetical protein
MKKLFAPLLKFLSNLAERIAGKKKSTPPGPCQFCGEMGHEANDCPNAAKYKLFHVDRE